MPVLHHIQVREDMMGREGISFEDFYMERENIIDSLLRMRAIGHLMSVASESEVGDNIPLLGLEIIDKCNQCIRMIEGVG